MNFLIKTITSNFEQDFLNFYKEKTANEHETTESSLG